jgi:hypothetical protein
MATHVPLPHMVEVPAVHSLPPLPPSEMHQLQLDVPPVQHVWLPPSKHAQYPTAEGGGSAASARASATR